MDTKKYMIIIKDEVKTSQIKSCIYNEGTKRWEVRFWFNSKKVYSYEFTNVEKLENPKKLNANVYQISREGREFFHVEEIYEFEGRNGQYWHICFGDGSERDYQRDTLTVVESCLGEERPKRVFEYIKELAGLCQIGDRSLSDEFEKIEFLGKDVVLGEYLDPSLNKISKKQREYIPIFPFGCNSSQYKAVRNAMENRISVIQGPPGTGKTQTILNIIANVLMEDKTVLIVSNNNSATENIYEKLSLPENDLGFTVASLGNNENKKRFIENQDEKYPNFDSWMIRDNVEELHREILEKSKQLNIIFEYREKKACLKQELSKLTKELEYFEQYIQEIELNIERLKVKKSIPSSAWMQLWQESQIMLDRKGYIAFLFKLKAYIKHGILLGDFYKQDVAKILSTFQIMYYRQKLTEISNDIKEIEIYLKENDQGLLEDMRSQSMQILKDKLAKKYSGNSKRTIFNLNHLNTSPDEVLKEYPVVLSTTFSSKKSFGKNVIYDYLIMDEASQIGIATGALALSCAKNVIIVGDMKQLPEVMNTKMRREAKKIFHQSHVPEEYRDTKCFLESILEVIPDVPQILLREHYRCHPKIINFCNEKFYNGELVIMTADEGEDDVLVVVKSTVGNHSRNHHNQREIDMIKEEIITEYKLVSQETGIITPYRKQVEEMGKAVEGFDISTVHKFQGLEKDNIIISVVDDEISDFADNSHLLNVAVSRAKKKLILVVTGNPQEKNRNIVDLIEYIQYHNFQVVESRIYSVFDYLYKQYTNERLEYLKKYKKVSEYDSENLMYALILEVLREYQYVSLDVVSHIPLCMVLKDLTLLNDQEKKYAMNLSSHLDFLIYSKMGKKPILAVEVDGYTFHKEGTVQAERDALKDRIMELYEIPLLRLQTNGSGEKEKIQKMLTVQLGN